MIAITDILQSIYKDNKKRKRLRNRRNRKVLRARGLSVSPHGFGCKMGYYVSGGSQTHSVTIGPLGFYFCDCGNGHHLCSHIIAVKLFRGEKV
jgi:hypothetical protein